MDPIISFFRDTLDGPVYIVVVVVAVILFFACIGYLAEKSINTKKEKAKYAKVEASDGGGAITEVSDNVNIDYNSVNSVDNVAPVVQNVDAMPTDTIGSVTPTGLGETSMVSEVTTSVNNNVNVDVPLNNSTSGVVEMPVVSEVTPVEAPVAPVDINQNSAVVPQDTIAAVIPTINQENGNNN